MHNRPKILSLSETELAQLLKECFFKVGKEIELSLEQIKILLDEIYKHQGWMYTDTFSEAFSLYAADELPEAETLRPQVSPRFVGKLMKAYIYRFSSRKKDKKQTNPQPAGLTQEEKYKLFIRFVEANKSMPGNADWVSIFEYLTSAKKLELPPEWNQLSYYAKRKYSFTLLMDWTSKNFRINR